MAKHPLESKYGLSSNELLNAVDARFRLKVALEGAVAEVQMLKKIALLVGAEIERFEVHDLDGHPDFSIWLQGSKTPLLAECKNVRESSKKGGAGYRRGGEIVAYAVETQKTRAAKGDPTSRLYGIEQFQILGVCLGKKTGNWSDFLFARSTDLKRHAQHPHKLAVLQRVPLPSAAKLRPWYATLAELLQSFGDPPCR